MHYHLISYISILLQTFASFIVTCNSPVVLWSLQYLLFFMCNPWCKTISWTTVISTTKITIFRLRLHCQFGFYCMQSVSAWNLLLLMPFGIWLSVIFRDCVSRNMAENIGERILRHWLIIYELPVTICPFTCSVWASYYDWKNWSLFFLS